MNNNIPRMPKVIQVQAAITTNGAKTTQYVNAGKCHRVIFLVSLKQAVAHETVISVYEAISAAGGSAAALSTAMPVWYSNDTETTDGDNLTLITSGATITAASTAKEKLFIIQVDPAIMTSGFDFLAIHATNSSQATNFLTVLAICENRHGGYDEFSLLD